jgi:hypothetical protein
VPRLVEIRRGDDPTYYWAVVRFSGRAYRVVRYEIPPTTESELYRNGERFTSAKHALARLEELAQCQHFVIESKQPGQWICIVETETYTYAVYTTPDHIYPQEEGQLVELCNTFKHARTVAERAAAK